MKRFKEIRKQYNINKLGIILYYTYALKLNKKSKTFKIRLLNPIGFIYLIFILLVSAIIYFIENIKEVFEDLSEYICLW